MKIIFKTGEQFDYIEALETSTFYDNANRRMLEVQLDTATVPLNTLNDLISNPVSTTEIVLQNLELGAETIFNDYEIKMELAVKPVSNGTDADGNEIKADRIVFKLGRLTTIEKQLKALGL